MMRAGAEVAIVPIIYLREKPYSIILKVEEHHQLMMLTNLLIEIFWLYRDFI